MRDFEKTIIDSFYWRDTDEATIDEINYTAEYGDAQELHFEDTSFVLCEKIYDDFCNYIIEKHGLDYLQKMHKKALFSTDTHDIYVDFCQKAAQITAKNILERLEQGND
jgi:hypothetical protein